MNFPFPVTWLQFVKQGMKKQGTIPDASLMWEILIHVPSSTKVKGTAHLNKDYSYMAFQNWVYLTVNQNENKEECRGEMQRESQQVFSHPALGPITAVAGYIFCLLAECLSYFDSIPSRTFNNSTTHRTNYKIIAISFSYQSILLHSLFNILQYIWQGITFTFCENGCSYGKNPKWLHCY